MGSLQPEGRDGHTPLTRFHVSATGHSVNYLPEYIATRRGFFAEQGLEVTATVPAPWDRVLDDLASREADAALGGIWVPSMFRGRGKSYTAFAQVSNRAPLALLRRVSATPFDWAAASGRTVLMKSGNGASVGLSFKMLLRERGVEPRDVNFVQDLDGAMLAALFVGGLGDFFFIDIITARTLAAKHPGVVEVAFEMARHDGALDIPWSVYYRETDTTTAQVRDVQRRFCVALGRAMRWINEHDAETFTDDLAELFPRAPLDIVVDVVNVYRKNNMWTTPSVSPAGFKRWQRGIADGFLIEEPFAYETIVDDGPASSARKLLEAGGG